ncbi:MAG TPA: hypothetical protein VK698_19730 [Kofleriaceae bacterium]|nr:hypothetical protein [Kofleriaceae bacterium]
MRRSRIPRGLQQLLVETMRVCRDPALLLWSLYILLFPLYVFKSGLPQPGDLLMVLLVPAVFMTGRNALFPAAIRPTRWLLLFTAYILLVNLVWTVVQDAYTLNTKDGFLLTCSFYIYNVTFFLCALVMYTRYRERFLWLTLQVTLASVVIQVLFSLVLARGGSRGEVLFNNPNQLGYYAVLSASILCLGRRQLGLRTLPATIGLMCSSYLALLSASKAALGAVAILVVVGLLSNPRFIIMSLIAFSLLLVSSDRLTDAITKARNRIDTDESAGFFEERGYDRILGNKEYWFFGAGEGGYRRFKETTIIGAHELHSSAGTIFFCYGIIGTILFVLFSWRVVQGSRFRYILILLPASAYGLTHQGLRFTLLWVLLAMFIALKDYERKPARVTVKRARPIGRIHPVGPVMDSRVMGK